MFFLDLSLYDHHKHTLRKFFGWTSSGRYTDMKETVHAIDFRLASSENISSVSWKRLVLYFSQTEIKTRSIELKPDRRHKWWHVSIAVRNYIFMCVTNREENAFLEHKVSENNSEQFHDDKSTTIRHKVWEKCIFTRSQGSWWNHPKFLQPKNEVQKGFSDIAFEQTSLSRLSAYIIEGKHRIF